MLTMYMWYSFSLLKIIYLTPILSFFNIKLLLYIGVAPINSVSGGLQRDSAIHIHVSIFPQTPLPSRLSHNIKQFPALYSRSLLVIHFKYSTVYLSLPFKRDRAGAV